MKTPSKPGHFNALDELSYSHRLDRLEADVERHDRAFKAIIKTLKALRDVL